MAPRRSDRAHRDEATSHAHEVSGWIPLHPEPGRDASGVAFVVVGERNQGMAKKRNPQDTTLRNLRAIKKRVRALEMVQKVILKRIGIGQAPPEPEYRSRPGRGRR